MTKKLTGNRCRCTVCGEHFNSVGTFDAHRVGRKAELRRCLSVAEMTGKGWLVADNGFWITKSRRPWYSAPLAEQAL